MSTIDSDLPEVNEDREQTTSNRRKLKRRR